MYIFYNRGIFPAILIAVLALLYFTPQHPGYAEEMMSKTQDQKKNEYSKEERELLLQLARKTLVHYFDTNNIMKIDEHEIPGKLKEIRGCFVTLEKKPGHALRGCIGNITPHKKLYAAIIDNAINAAIHDHRFRPLTKEELPGIEIEISILTVPKQLEFSSPDELLKKIRPGIDGVYLFFGNHSSTYLPQVWEKLPDKKEFFSSLCQKGGAPPDCWRRKEVKVHTYQAEYFSESKH